ncbi:hypothetical protein R3P38DRAFT_2633785 [Favolaschia claudopus]|uniref:Uncharacterized protein n=1 Tax=Favolaschia claudopus TaxID=2862362 RepID=A0AAW0AZ33_9AGAR
MTTDIDAQGNPPPYDSTKSPSDLNNHKTGLATGAAEPRYLYYRVFAPDGAIPVKTVFDPANPYVGRITARSVPPPHNVKSLQRCLLNAERFSDPDHLRTDLYQAAGSNYPAGSGESVAIVNPTYGATPETPFALVHKERLMQAETEEVQAIDVSSRCENHPNYVYYRLYTPIGEDTSKESFEPTEPSVGRIEWSFVSPPRSSSSLTHRIAEVEGNPRYRFAEVYQDISAQQELQRLAFKPGNDLGSLESPLVLVQSERRRGLLNRPAKVTRLVYNIEIAPGGCFRGGEVVYTDGVEGWYHKYNCTLRKNDPQHRSAYIDIDYLELLDE